MLLSISDVRLSYAGLPVLEIPQLELPPGFYEVRGANGSGKTTLLKAIAGLLPLSRSGAIALDGLDSVRDRVAYRRVCGFAEAEPLYPEFLTGAELYAFYVKTKGAEGPMPRPCGARSVSTPSSAGKPAPTPAGCSKNYRWSWPGSATRCWCSWTNPSSPSTPPPLRWWKDCCGHHRCRRS